eukprot:Blabericola_migrator_1__5174@NODE_266_length_10604_cov_114_195881_g222_i0_p3_GENE_NODE_266_length_10604_cov_114_195881_g222_i0NODE_266_length_10604_cov_114_195881_g222_i0_p3_ORF_typecomplete_len488_score48_66Mem_trans/PF03547_18/0_0008_NODE_266_length_10604_cov_114_195881_g222_i068538316
MRRHLLIFRSSDASFVVVSLMVIKFIISGLIAVKTLGEDSYQVRASNNHAFARLCIISMTILMTLSFIFYWIGLLPVSDYWQTWILYGSLACCSVSSALMALLYGFTSFHYLLIYQIFDCTIFLLYAMTGADFGVVSIIAIAPFVIHCAAQLSLVGFRWDLFSELLLVTLMLHLMALLIHSKIYGLALQQLEVECDPARAARALPYYSVMWSHAMHATQRFLEATTAQAMKEGAPKKLSSTERSMARTRHPRLVALSKTQEDNEDRTSSWLVPDDDRLSMNTGLLIHPRQQGISDSTRSTASEPAASTSSHKDELDLDEEDGSEAFPSRFVHHIEDLESLGRYADEERSPKGTDSADSDIDQIQGRRGSIPGSLIDGAPDHYQLPTMRTHSLNTIGSRVWMLRGDHPSNFSLPCQTWNPTDILRRSWWVPLRYKQGRRVLVSVLSLAIVWSAIPLSRTTFLMTLLPLSLRLTVMGHQRRGFLQGIEA